MEWKKKKPVRNVDVQADTKETSAYHAEVKSKQLADRVGSLARIMIVKAINVDTLKLRKQPNHKRLRRLQLSCLILRSCY